MRVRQSGGIRTDTQRGSSQKLEDENLGYNAKKPVIH